MCMCIYIYIHTHISLCACVCVCVFVCIWCHPKIAKRFLLFPAASMVSWISGLLGMGFSRSLTSNMSTNQSTRTPR